MKSITRSSVLVCTLGVMDRISNILSGLNNFAQDIADYGITLRTVIINAGTFIAVLFVNRT